jgi:hypothetical protein
MHKADPVPKRAAPRADLGSKQHAPATRRRLPAGSCAETPDTELLQLAKQYDEARATQDAFFAADGSDDEPDEAADAVVGVCWAVVDQIISTKATTLEGMQIKARILRECRDDGCDLGMFDGIMSGHSTPDRSLAASITRDLLTMLAERPLPAA